MTTSFQASQAARLYGARDVRLESIAVPPLQPGDALVRVRSVGLCGSDLHYYRDGRIGDSLAAQPLVLGHEFAGEIVATEGTSLTPGTLVAVDPADPCDQCESCEHGHPNLCTAMRFCGTPPTEGGLQECYVWPARRLFALPPGMDAETGALLEPLGVLIHAMDLAKVRLADTVAVLGSGPIGLLAIHLARLSGASRVLATDVLPERVAAAREFGASAVADAWQVDIAAWVKAETGGRGVDVAIECAGAPETPAQAVAAVRPGGCVVLVGIPEDDRIELAAAPARRKGVTIKLCRRMKHTYPRAIALVQAGMVDLHRLVTHRYPLAQTAAAFASLDHGAGSLKVMVTP